MTSNNYGGEYCGYPGVFLYILIDNRNLSNEIINPRKTLKNIT